MCGVPRPGLVWQLREAAQEDFLFWGDRREEVHPPLPHAFFGKLLEMDVNSACF